MPRGLLMLLKLLALCTGYLYETVNIALQNDAILAYNTRHCMLYTVILLTAPSLRT